MKSSAAKSATAASSTGTRLKECLLDFTPRRAVLFETADADFSCRVPSPARRVNKSFDFIAPDSL
jgi:hypothetical protein